jgi:hypothetical protein
MRQNKGLWAGSGEERNRPKRPVDIHSGKSKISARGPERTAYAATAPSIREDFVGLERRWLRLAQSWELSQRLACSMSRRSSDPEESSL